MRGILFALAWRNLWRQRRRSLMTVFAIAFVVMFSLLYYGIGGASINSMYQRLTGEIGHAQVQAAGGDLLTNESAVRAQIAPHLDGGVLVGVLETQTLLASGQRARGVLLVGRDWPAPLSNDLEERLVAGAIPQPDDLDGLLLDEVLARALAVGPGDPLTAYTPDGASTYRVAGLLRAVGTGARVAYVSLAAAQSRLTPDSVTRFELHYPDLRHAADDARAAAVAQALQPTLGDAYLARTWREVQPGLVAVLEVIDPMMYIVTLIFFVLAGLLVLNTMYLSLIERVREFGVIAALGASRGQLVRLILTESLLLCLTGAAAGLALGLALVGYLSRGFSIPGLDAYYESFGLNPVFYPSVTPEQVAFAVLFTLGTAFLSALWPALIAARLEPVEAMRHTA